MVVPASRGRFRVLILQQRSFSERLSRSLAETSPAKYVIAHIGSIPCGRVERILVRVVILEMKGV